MRKGEVQIRRPGGKPGAWTVHDIAQVAGVSAKTVSRVVNKQSGVSEATRARITQIIEDVGYHPHMGARIMRSSPRDCIGLTLSAPPNEVPFSQQVIQRIFAELYRIFGAKGDYVCLDLNPFRRNPNADYARGLWEQRYGGCIVSGPLAIEDQSIVRIHRSGHPYIALGRLTDFPETSCATVDFEEGAYLSTRFLLERGHKRIGLLQGFGRYHSGLERRHGYFRALAEAGIEPDESLIRPVTFGSRDIITGVHRLLADHATTALIDSSGAEDAASVRDGARRAGRVPGQDCDIVAWTYTDNATVLSEACAHVWLPLDEAAVEGFDLLADWFHGLRDGPIHVVYPPTLYETIRSDEIPKPRPFFDVLR
ncbi:MAG: LacI family DNA-binding transcriptional regulator [Candidatus Hydrogenedentes bacterium]|nr:LacI family DNA-binding transcriptional regulator [Candidatus Hydrogenedentota bacterium]